MAYVEYLRARRALAWYFGILIGLYLLGLAIAYFGHGMHGHAGVTIDINTDQATPGGMPPAGHHIAHVLPLSPFPISLLAYSAAFGAILIAAILGSSLNRQREHLPLVWTRPLGRERSVLSALAVDALAIFVTLLGTLGLFKIVAFSADSNALHWYLDSLVLPTLVLGFGAALMTYALSQAVTSWTLGAGGLIKGLVSLACGVLVVLGANRLPSPYDSLVGALNYLNPLAYYLPVHVADKHVPIVLEYSRYLPLGLGIKIACVWLLAAAYMAIATYGWKRLES
jgi:hypothetical protein